MDAHAAKKELESLQMEMKACLNAKENMDADFLQQVVSGIERERREEWAFFSLMTFLTVHPLTTPSLSLLVIHQIERLRLTQEEEEGALNDLSCPICGDVYTNPFTLVASSHNYDLHCLEEYVRR